MGEKNKIMNTPERILCAAIHFDDGNAYEHQPTNIQTGFVVTGRRHHNCYHTLQAIAECFGVEGIAKNKIEKTGRDQQGFITSSNRYVSRKEGFVIAKANNQIFHALHDDSDEGILVSEDLY